MTSRPAFLLLVILTIITNVYSLRSVRLVVPHAVRLGSPTLLLCQFTLDGDALYSVKWYKGGREFFRYTPKETPAFKVFPMPGLTQHDIKTDESNATQVSLREISGSMAGVYSCEVSADAPSFHTVVVSAHLNVVEIPSGQPMLSGLKPRYRVGDWIMANCTSPGSKPGTNITWSINGHHVPKQAVRQYREMDRDDLEVSMSTVRLLAKTSLFPDGRMKIKCIASIYNLYWQTIEKNAEIEPTNPNHPNEIQDSDLQRETDSSEGDSNDFIETGVSNDSNGGKCYYTDNHLISFSGYLLINLFSLWF